MSKLERAFVDSADQTFKKVTARDGRTMHFKDGTPVTQNAFNGGLANKEYDGENVKVAVPSDKGPGYVRKEVSHEKASALGQELRLMRNDVPGQPRDQITIDGVTYNTYDLQELNDKIVERHGNDAIMKY